MAFEPDSELRKWLKLESVAGRPINVWDYEAERQPSPEEVTRYREHLTTIEWGAFRKRIIMARQLCEVCLSSGKLVLHHRHYLSVGSEQPYDVVLLCPTCHGYVHQLVKERVFGYVMRGDDGSLPGTAAQQRRLDERREYAEYEASGTTKTFSEFKRLKEIRAVVALAKPRGVPFNVIKRTAYARGMTLTEAVELYL